MMTDLNRLKAHLSVAEDYASFGIVWGWTATAQAVASIDDLSALDKLISKLGMSWNIGLYDWDQLEDDTKIVLGYPVHSVIYDAEYIRGGWTLEQLMPPERTAHKSEAAQLAPFDVKTTPKLHIYANGVLNNAKLVKGRIAWTPQDGPLLDFDDANIPSGLDLHYATPVGQRGEPEIVLGARLASAVAAWPSSAVVEVELTSAVDKRLDKLLQAANLEDAVYYLVYRYGN